MKPTQEQVIAWAREAGLWPAVTDTFPSEAERFAALAYEAGRKDENEACAKVCEAQENRMVAKHPARIEFDPDSMMARKCAAAIRARREQ